MPGAGDEMNGALTPRESSLIELLSSGLIYKQIAAIAEVTEGTVKVYFQRLREKTQCATNAQLIAWWCRNVECPRCTLRRAHELGVGGAAA